MQKSLKWFLYLVLIVTILLAASLVYREADRTPNLMLDLELPASGIDFGTTAILVKKGDQFSEATAKLYQSMRHIPPENVFYIELPDQDSVSPEVFQKSYSNLLSQLPDRIQAMVATWQQPYKVGCMSITSALTFGYDSKWCHKFSGQCATTAISPYFNSAVDQPWSELKIRPTMLLSGTSLKEIEDLITRGIQADFSYPKQAPAYLVRTHDKNRSSRWPLFQYTAHKHHSSQIQIQALDLSAPDKRDYLQNKNIFIYETGKAQVPNIDTNTYLPGAIADHLTSFGGKGFDDEGQMKAVRWLEAGATATYGTVVEPCNFPSKFPNPAVFIPNYELGKTVLESYWKSVQMPGEGLFIGEPLARPFGVLKVKQNFDHFTVLTNRLDPNKNYQAFYWDKHSKQYKKAKRFSFYHDTKKNLSLLQISGVRSDKYKIALLTN